MNSEPQSKVTHLLIDWSNGDETAMAELWPLVYGELLRLARSKLRHERKDHTLETGALVHEAYMRLVDQRRVQWKNRAQFFALAARMMRRILYNYAEARNAQRRGAGAAKVTLDDAVAPVAVDQLDLIALDRALNQLAELDPRQAEIVELHFFGGVSYEEIAQSLEISLSTVKREWNMAKTWLFRAMN
ncbi:MAG TPA: sigma-70 family RNA polymerase sigma factor [Pyrinomonadaceae bacterium]|nr:sigma-70 family RNA polymerase sigma factor [Pyrinomonadaceae bacterium]